MADFLMHYGVEDQKWGIRRYQNEDGTLTELGKIHYRKLDERWAKKNRKKVTSLAKKATKNYMNNYTKNVLGTSNLKLKSGKISKNYINAYNKELAKAMSQSVSSLRTPSGKIVAFVANRGQIGVSMAIADEGYDFTNLSKGVWADGRIAYKKDKVETTDWSK